MLFFFFFHYFFSSFTQPFSLCARLSCRLALTFCFFIKFKGDSLVIQQKHGRTSENRRISFRRFFIACIDVLIERRRVVVEGADARFDDIGTEDNSAGGVRIFRLETDDDEGTDRDRLCKAV
jgi:hypothetical protein